MIPTFPLDLDARTLLVLASALATDVTWTWPFDRRRPSAWVANGRHRHDGAASASTHTQLIADTEAAGLVAVHACDAGRGSASSP